MLELYGEEWTFELLGKDEAQALALVAQGRAPRPWPDASADEPSLNLSPAAVESRAENSPGSGQDTSWPGSGVTPGSRNPGSGVSVLRSDGYTSPGPSWSSRTPGTPSRLSREIGRPYDPDRESLDKYQDRLRRQARALTALGEPLAESVLGSFWQRVVMSQLCPTLL